MNMNINLSSLPWLRILLALIFYSFLGAAWFTVLFKNPYLLSLGKENAPEQPFAAIFIVGPAICTLIVVIASAILLKALDVTTYSGALVFAMVVGFGYLVANTFNIAINPNIPRPILYGLISGSFHLVGITISCLILVAKR